jgi:hypothetical protein
MYRGGVIMGHYSDLWESVSIEEIENEIKRHKEYLTRMKKRKEVILKDIESPHISKETKETCQNFIDGQLKIRIVEALRKEKELEKCKKDYEDGKIVQGHRGIKFTRSEIDYNTAFLVHIK